MKKQMIIFVATLALIHSGALLARELRAPIPFRNGFQRFEHYPYLCEDFDKCWDFDAYLGAWHRESDGAFRHGTRKETLAQLIFGSPSFFLINAFPPGTNNGGFAALTLAELTPLLNYSENGVMFALNINRRLDCGTWDVGARFNIPFRAVTVTADNTVGDQSFLAAISALLINNPVDMGVPNNPGFTPNPTAVANSFAYRLDALNALGLVNFSNPTTKPTPGSVTIANQVVDNTGAAAPGQSTPVNVLSSTTTPTPPFSLANTFVDALDPLPGNGDLANGTRARFVSGTNYTPLGASATNQGLLWITPTDFNAPITVPVDPATPLVISTAAANIAAAVTAALASTSASQTVAQFLATRNVNFNTQHLSGAGDLDVDFYARRNFLCGCHGDWYVEGIVGLRFPTGKRVHNPGNLYAQPLGNNGHTEIKGGAQVGWNPCDWFAVKADITGYHVFKRKERVAAAFTGATVRNIGPTVDARISWNYLLANLDLTFYRESCNGCSGIDIGYQPYYKFRDKVTFEQLTAADFLGNTQTLDATILERNTKRSVHRIKTEIFHKTCDWEIYGGWLHSIAGRNIQRETDWYAAMAVFF